MSGATAPATAFAAALLTSLVERGVTELVVAPGSRSQALALVAAELDAAGVARLRVRLDERDAAFLALGTALETGRPAVVITTSGTAVANLHPAVLEAHHSGVPLIVLSADRPEELRGIGSNQTTMQPGMFGEAVRATIDVPAPRGESGEGALAVEVAARVIAAAATGPVHLNVAFADPLSSPWSYVSRVVEPVQTTATPVVEPVETTTLSLVEPVETTTPSPVVEPFETITPEPAATLAPGPRTAVIAGTGAGPRAEQVARELGAVLFAEATSGARFGPNLVVPYREVIRDEDFLAGLERVVVFGHPTLSREVPLLVARPGIETIVVERPGVERFNPGRAVGRFVTGIEVAGALDVAAARAWVGPWIAVSRAHLERTDDIAPEVFATQGEKARSELAAVRAGVTRRALVDALWRATWPHDRLVVAASRLIRELDRAVPGKAITVHANRGLAGIDGTISTAVGVALAQQAAPLLEPAGAAARGGAGDLGSLDRRGGGITRLLIGDLAFLHDVGGLAFGEGEDRPRILVVVGNDGGGTIFDGLEVGASAPAGFDRVMLTPQTASIEGLARAYGWDYRRVDSRGDLDPALSTCTGPTVVEVPLPR